MVGKRHATTDLNHDNWDEEDEPEEHGTYRTATEEEMKKRVVKKARRTISDESKSPSEPNTGVFSKFSGFTKTQASSSSGGDAPFAFLSKITAISTNAVSSVSTTKPIVSFAGPSTKLDSEKSQSECNEKSTDYYASIKGLNQAVCDWIKENVEQNPLCVLTPIFKEYENFLDSIAKEHNKPSTDVKSEGSTKTDPIIFGNIKSTAPSKVLFNKASFTFNSTPISTDDTKTTSATTKPLFNFSLPSTSSAVSPKPSTSAASAISTFKFNASTSSAYNPIKAAFTSTTTSIFGGFTKPSAEVSKTNGISKSSNETSESRVLCFGKPSFSPFTSGSIKPFQFGNVEAPPPSTSSTKENNEADEEDQPPKVEFNQVVENDAVYSKKCKVFVKKDNNYVDRGIGTLYLKPVKDSEKKQLIVRADTNLGNILINLILNSGIPVRRTGKNNVMLVCLPTPDVEKPTAILLRVKTSEDADDLLKTIESYQK